MERMAAYFNFNNDSLFWLVNVIVPFILNRTVKHIIIAYFCRNFRHNKMARFFWTMVLNNQNMT